MVSFVHLSDLHFRSEYTKSNMTNNFPGVGDPTQKLKRALELIARLNPDFILITGDMTHEGDEEDYRALLSLLLEPLYGIQVIPVPGNHDSSEAFASIMMTQPYTGDPLDSTTTIEGLKIVILDGGRANAAGVITKSQLDWLENELSQPGKNGTILAIHQPFTTGIEWLNTKVPEGFEKRIENRVDAIFCGHTHVPNLSHFHSIPQLTAGGIGFGAGFAKGAMLMTNEASMFHCQMENGLLNFSPILISPEPCIAQTIDLGGLHP